MFFFRRTLLFCIALFIGSAGFAETFEEKCGIGVVEISPYNYFSIAFWRGPDIEKPFIYDEVNFFLDSSKTLRYTFATTGSDSLPSWFDPQVFEINKQEKKFELICVSKKEDWCEVIADKKSGMTKWVQLGFDVRFLDWPVFLPTVRAIEIVKGDSLLYANPNAAATSAAINLNYDHSYIQEIHCKEIQGMWMSVEIVELDEFGKAINTRTGWIKWRNENEFLVAWYA